MTVSNAFVRSKKIKPVYIVIINVIKRLSNYVHKSVVGRYITLEAIPSDSLKEGRPTYLDQRSLIAVGAAHKIGL